MTKTEIDLDRFTSADEAKFARRLIRKSLAAGYSVSVNDGEEWTVKRSTSFDEITAAMASTGADTIRIHGADGKGVGSFYLVYQNGAGDEVIADYSDNEETNAVYREVVKD